LLTSRLDLLSNKGRVCPNKLNPLLLSTTPWRLMGEWR